jgi:hypothetical protein
MEMCIATKVVHLVVGKHTAQYYTGCKKNAAVTASNWLSVASALLQIKSLFTEFQHLETELYYTSSLPNAS